jgi:hypothetical protein
MIHADDPRDKGGEFAYADRMAIPEACWLTPSAEVRASPIEGLGLFAIREIAEGETVMRLGGRLIDDAALAALTAPYSSVAIDEGRHLLIDPAHPVRYGNHSCAPNLWMEGALIVVARRPIAPGEELTIDYATQTGTEAWRMSCRCGARDCRGEVTGADWRLPELRAAYGDHWTPMLLRRMPQG